MNKRLLHLNSLAESLDSDRKEDEDSKVEKSDVPRETSSEDNTEEKKEDTSVSVTAVSAKVEVSGSSGKKIYGDKKDFVTYKDDNSKAPTPVPREMGSKQSVKDFKVTNAKMDTDEPVPREMGSQESVQDFKVTNAKMDTEEPVPREMGSKDAPKKFLEGYKSNIKSLLNGIKESIKL